eukprot:scaffold77004_cov63-Phaeocystis_antarctica.AAC.2
MDGYLSAPLREKRASPNRFFHMGIASRISKSARERNRSHVSAGHVKEPGRGLAAEDAANIHMCTPEWEY